MSVSLNLRLDGLDSVRDVLAQLTSKQQKEAYAKALNDKATDVRRVRNHPQALPARPAAVPNALPDVHPMRRTADSKTPAPIPADSRTAPGQVQGGAGRLDGARAQRAAVAGAGKGCVGCGGCGVMGVAV